MNTTTLLPTPLEAAEAQRNADHLRALRVSHIAPEPREAVTVLRALHVEDADDAVAIRRLAQLDSAPMPSGRMLGAEIDGKLVAAISLTDGNVISDPFRATSNAIQLLSLRAQQLHAAKATKGTSRVRRVLDALGRGNAHAGLAGSPPGAGGKLLQL